ncbi:MAG TPA: hypothetical protein VFC92_13005 [Bacteroidales bacterium]|nr:hypothetical protein [Bacteroidales bacterium]
MSGWEARKKQGAWREEQEVISNVEIKKLLSADYLSLRRREVKETLHLVDKTSPYALTALSSGSTGTLLNLLLKHFCTLPEISISTTNLPAL